MRLDEASVVSRNVGAPQVKVRENYPHALFVHSYSHVMNLVFQQSVSDIKERIALF
jgi:hypothetical protein